MFVKNKEKIDFKYRKGTYLAVLKAMTVSYVDETKVSAKDLLDCYGQRIDIISRDLAVEIAPHVTKVEKEEYVPFMYKSYSNFFPSSEHTVENKHVGITKYKDIALFNKSDNLEELFKENYIYDIAIIDSKLIDV